MSWREGVAYMPSITPHPPPGEMRVYLHQRTTFDELEELMRSESHGTEDVTYSDVWHVWGELPRPLEMRSQPSTPTDVNAQLSAEEDIDAVQRCRDTPSGSADFKSALATGQLSQTIANAAASLPSSSSTDPTGGLIGFA